jgi:sulfur carrier protein
MISLSINGSVYDMEDAATVADVLTKFELGDQLVVIEHNGEIVDRDAYPHTRLHPNDKIEVVRFVGGG